MANPDFTTVTEVTGYQVTKEQVQRMYTRYRFAASFCEGKDVLEVACGSGQGLGCLAETARKVIGGDIDEKNLGFAREHYAGRNNIELKVLDALKMPFQDNAFDVVILYEAIYYLSDAAAFIREAGRVLREGGTIIIGTVNREWDDFNPSPYSYKYFSAEELLRLLRDHGFKAIELYGDSPVKRATKKEAIVSFVKQSAVKFGLMPKTMKGKELLKRIFCGRLQPMPPELCDQSFAAPAPQRLPEIFPQKGFKVLFALGRK